VERNPDGSGRSVCNEESDVDDDDGPAYMTIEYVGKLEQQYRRDDTKKYNFDLTNGIPWEGMGRCEQLGQQKPTPRQR
jgi:hypothetical protein